jgi:putative ATPase
MRKTGYGKDYKYPHAFDEAITNQKYLPENLQGKKYYYPKEIGFEKEIKRRLDYIRKKRRT